MRSIGFYFIKTAVVVAEVHLCHDSLQLRSIAHTHCLIRINWVKLNDFCCACAENAAALLSTRFALLLEILLKTADLISGVVSLVNFFIANIILFNTYKIFLN